MQRYLDHDLNEEERLLLFEHIGYCEACAEMFERLSDLSARLEKLPQVMPNFSLVDAILPQLEEIDRARLEEGSTVESSALPTMSMDKSTSGELAAVPNEQDIRRRSDRKVRQRSWINRYVALGAAAVLILGVFISQYEPRTVSDAGGSMGSQQSESLNDQLSGSSSAADKAAGEMSPRFKVDDGSTNNKEISSDLPDQMAKAPVIDKQPTSSDGGSTEGGSKQPGSGHSPQASQPDRSSEGILPSDQLRTGSPGHSSSGNPEGADQVQPEVQEPAHTELFANPGDELDSGDMNQRTQQQQEPTDQAIVADIGDKYLLSGQLLVWSSPDGAFDAEVKEEHLYIYKWESGERKQVHAEPLDGDWVTGGWSAEGYIFTYQTEKDGAAINHKFEAGHLTEKNDEGKQP